MAAVGGALAEPDQAYEIRTGVRREANPNMEGPVEPGRAPGSASAPAKKKRIPRPTLTDRQEEVLYCVSEGMTREQGAAAMRISLRTYRSHLERLFAKYEVRSQRELLPHCWRYFR